MWSGIVHGLMPTGWVLLHGGHNVLAPVHHMDSSNPVPVCILVIPPRSGEILLLRRELPVVVGAIFRRLVRRITHPLGATRVVSSPIIVGHCSVWGLGKDTGVSLFSRQLHGHHLVWGQSRGGVVNGEGGAYCSSMACCGGYHGARDLGVLGDCVCVGGGGGEVGQGREKGKVGSRVEGLSEREKGGGKKG